MMGDWRSDESASSVMERHTFQPEGVGKESVLVFTFESRIEPTRIDTQQRNSCYTAGIFAILHLYE